MAVLIRPSEQEQFLDRVLGGDGGEEPPHFPWRDKRVIVAALAAGACFFRVLMTGKRD